MLQLAGRNRKLVIRENLFTDRAQREIDLHQVVGGQSIDIYNNTFSGDQWFTFVASVENLKFRVYNNLTVEPSKGFLLRVAKNSVETIDGLQVGHNVFRTHSGAGMKGVVPLGPTDRIAEVELLSRDRSRADYLRLAAGSPLARAGAGGAWPSHVGALLPGPARRMATGSHGSERWGYTKSQPTNAK